MALRQESDSLGTLQQDLLQIAIDRFGQEEWDKVISADEISKQKVDTYIKEQVIAIKAFLQRQRLTITDLEAFGIIEAGKIQMVGQSAPTGPGPAIFAPTVRNTPGDLRNADRIKFRVQVSNRANKLNISEVGKQVKNTIVQFLNRLVD